VRIFAGDRSRSDLFERMRRRDAFGMPPLATSIADPLGLDLVGAWIDAGAN
jgi:hypothetical protein